MTMKKLFAVLLGLVSLWNFAQDTRMVGEFSSLKAYDRIKVDLVKSRQGKVEVYGDNNGDVEVVNKNGELKIRMKTVKLLQGSEVKVKVFYDDLNTIQASQGAIILSDDTLKSEMLKLTSNEGSKIELKINSSVLDVKGNSGGTLSLQGKANTQSIVVNSGAVFNGKNMDGDNVSVTANAGGEAHVYAEKSVKATTRAGGTIEVYGNPKNRDTKKFVGGSISFK